MKIMSIFGTRPEAIKMCPLVQALNKQNINNIVCLTGQHREMVKQVIDIFGIKVDYDLNIMRQSQTLTTITIDILSAIEDVLKQEKPDLVLVHGDTTTSFVAALAAFYQKIPVGHVEAGLRTYNMYSPFPEEVNRNLTSKLAELHFAPTIKNLDNLNKENIFKNVFVTGNTVLDAFKTTVKEDYIFKNKMLKEINFNNKRCILVTAHRRENIGKPLENICEAIKEIALTYQDVNIVYPVHPNPVVKEAVYRMLDGIKNIYLIEPVDVEDMHNLMNRSYLVMTDSGGLQEEAPSFGVPVLVLRTETEREEAVDANTVKLVGVLKEEIYDSTKELLECRDKYMLMANAKNPFGDGHASEKIIDAIISWYRQKQRG